ncbi:MAG: polynucleotide adenylyltransferase PcnB, partial [Gammaproteobacteria bacterium HGW-Gammaproteobacteria-10]
MLNFFKKIISSSTGTPSIPAKDDNPSHPEVPRIYSRSEHNISRSQISENALKVLYR